MAIGLGSILMAAGSIYTGVTSLLSKNKASEELIEQGSIAVNEAFRNASIIREEGRKFAATQSLQFIGSGVELTGSALITLEQTRSYAEAEAKAVEERGKAQARLARKNAEIKQSEGRSSFIGSIISGISNLIPNE